MISGMLDLFAGSGVGVAAHNLGITEYGVENMKAAVATRDAAGFLTPYNDAWDIDRPYELGLEFNTLWASPPCQTFSSAGKGKGREALDTVVSAIHAERYKSMDSLKELGAEVGDERTALVLTPLAYIYRYTPAYVVLEQVPTVLPVWEECANVLRSWGYSVWVGNLHSEQYGVPQTRKRAYLIARKGGAEALPPAPTHSKYYSHSPAKLDGGVQGWVSMYEGLARADLPAWTHERPATTVVGSFGADVISAPGYRTVGGYSRQNAPDSVKVTLNEAALLQGYPSAWGITDQPSPTVTSHLGVTRSPSGTQRVYLDAIERGAFEFKQVDPIPSKVAVDGIGSRYAPNTINLNTEEGGRIQGFPFGFPFQGSKTSQHLQVGNAVPPPVAEAVLRGFME